MCELCDNETHPDKTILGKILMVDILMHHVSKSTNVTEKKVDFQQKDNIPKGGRYFEPFEKKNTNLH